MCQKENPLFSPQTEKKNVRTTETLDSNDPDDRLSTWKRNAAPISGKECAGFKKDNLKCLMMNGKPRYLKSQTKFFKEHWTFNQTGNRGGKEGFSLSSAGQGWFGLATRVLECHAGGIILCKQWMDLSINPLEISSVSQLLARIVEERFWNLESEG
jgi:hypothetical protein